MLLTEIPARPIHVNTIVEAHFRTFEQNVHVKSKILVISGASAVGKSTLIDMMSDVYTFGRLRNFTTRAQRPNEDLSEIICINENQLINLSEAGEVFAYHYWEGNGRTYGLLRSEIEHNPHPMLVYQTTWLGYILKSQRPENVINVWLINDDRGELLRRMTKRGTEPGPEIFRRLATTMMEQQHIIDNQDQLLAEGKIDFILNGKNRTPQSTMHALTEFLTSINFNFAPR